MWLSPASYCNNSPTRGKHLSCRADAVAVACKGAIFLLRFPSPWRRTWSMSLLLRPRHEPRSPGVTMQSRRPFPKLNPCSKRLGVLVSGQYQYGNPVAVTPGPSVPPAGRQLPLPCRPVSVGARPARGPSGRRRGSDRLPREPGTPASGDTLKERARGAPLPS